MQYLLLIYDQESEFAKMSKDENEKMYAEYMEFTADIKAKGNHLAGHQLQPIATATTVRIRNGKRLTTDGPFAETKEQLGGFYMIEAKNLDEAIEIASRIPSAQSGLDRGAAARCTWAGGERINAEEEHDGACARHRPNGRVSRTQRCLAGG